MVGDEEEERGSLKVSEFEENCGVWLFDEMEFAEIDDNDDDDEEETTNSELWFFLLVTCHPLSCE